MSARLLAAPLLLALPLGVLATERILDYDSRIEVRADSTLDVIETIRVRAEGAQIRRGIYRDFPTVYVDRRGERVTTGFDLVGVMRDGRPEPFREERRANGVRVYVGDPDTLLPPGDYGYEIVYRTDRQIGFFADHDELYWNVTGNGWDFAIDRARAEVRLPAGVPADRIDVEAYTGPHGVRGTAFVASVDTGVPVFATTATLGPREGLTIVVSWPRGYVATPGIVRRAGYTLRDAWPAVVGLGGLATLLGYYLFAWFRVGRDPPGRIAVPHYEPPPGQSPAAMRFLRELKYDDRNFAAGILSLAVRGYLSIEETSTGLFGRSRGYTLEQRSPDPRIALGTDESALLAALFAQGPRLEIDDSNHTRIQAARQAHESALKRHYTPHFFRINGGWHGFGVVLSLALAALAVAIPLSQGGFDVRWFGMTPAGWTTLAAVALGLVANGAFGRLLRAPTVAGRAVMDRIEGFRLYLDVAEGDALKLVNAPPLTPRLFEDYLPAALALDVEQRWARRFAGVFAAHAADSTPLWYHGDRWDASDVGRFSSSFGASFASAIAAASTAPGSSSGSGGGGSSGGGGGGGGGGGW